MLVRVSIVKRLQQCERVHLLREDEVELVEARVKRLDGQVALVDLVIPVAQLVEQAEALAQLLELRRGLPAAAADGGRVDRRLARAGSLTTMTGISSCVCTRSRDSRSAVSSDCVNSNTRTRTVGKPNMFSRCALAEHEQELGERRTEGRRGREGRSIRARALDNQEVEHRAL